MLLIKNISKSVVSKTLFEDVSFKVAKNQKVGLVGPNGVGKTTMLKIVAGLTEADKGSVQTGQEVLGYLPQKIASNENQMIYEYLFRSLEHDWEDYKITTCLAKVGLGKVDQTKPIKELSGGQKMRLGLARILLDDPTVLLLDEPTNNLDIQSIQWLERFVKRFEGSVLVVSHDRQFLDVCVKKIIELEPFTHHIHEYGGNYSYFVEEKKRRQENIATDYRLQQQKEKKMQAWIAERKERLTYHQSTKGARQLEAMKKRLTREVDQNRVDKPQEYSSFSISVIGNELHKNKSVLVLKHFLLPGLVTCKELFVFASDRINLSGKNGSGKTTLIKTIMGKLSNYEGEIEIGTRVKPGYFSQEHELLDLSSSVIDNFTLLTTVKSESKARKKLGGYLFKGDTVFSIAGGLSEGEKARLLLAILITQGNDFLFLDEPTNHLDLESREVLEEALKKYNGGFLVVSHDRYFLRNIGITRKLVIEDEVLVEKTL